MNKELLRKTLRQVKIIICVLGVICLALNITLFIAYGFSDKAYIVIQKPVKGHYAAFSVVSAPERFDQTGSVSFVPFGLDLRQGDTAFVQTGVKKDGVQHNSAPEYSYDKNIVSVKNGKSNGRGGAVIAALAPGQTVLAAIADGELRPICLITVK